METEIFKKNPMIWPNSVEHVDSVCIPNELTETFKDIFYNRFEGT